MHSSTLPTLTIGTRTSALALWQTQHIIAQLQAAWPGLTCTIRHMTTQGDQTQAQNRPLPEIGGKGLFTLELEEALRQGEIDLAVHSLKDLPVENAPGLTIGAIPQRAPVEDVLIARDGLTLATLPAGAVVGTSSPRRAAQLLAVRPDLTIRSIRGNVGTRLRKVQSGDYDATVLAAAGVERLALTEHVNEWLPLTIMLPAPGQGALAVQCRADDEPIHRLLAPLEDQATRLAVNAEREFLRVLGGGCSAPIAAYAHVIDVATNQVELTTLVSSLDGQRVIRVQGQGATTDLADALAAQAFAAGAASLLEARPDRSQTTATSQPLPLQGRRIGITRPQAQAQELAAQLQALGAQPILLPMITIEPVADQQPLAQAIAQIAQYDWLVFTSANAVTIWQTQWQMSGRPLADLAHLHIAAIGPATADALRAIGLEATVMPATFVAEALAERLGDLTGQRVLLPQARAARTVLADQLRAQGATVAALAIYDTLAVPLTPLARAELAQGIDVLIFTSGSTVRNLLAAVQDDPELWPQVQAARPLCIGPVTADTARELGFRELVQAPSATDEGLVQAVVTLMGVNR